MKFVVGSRPGCVQVSRPTGQLVDRVGHLVLGDGHRVRADPPLAALFGVGAFGYGLLDTFFGAGAAIGGLYGRRVDERTERRWIILGLVGVAAGWAIVAGAPWFGLVLV